MSGTAITHYSERCSILSELWLDYKDNKDFADLIKYGNLGFPLACAIDSGIVESTTIAEEYINELWTMLMIQLKTEDTGFWIDLEDLLGSTGYYKDRK
jgi:hypothetical protein